jgi:acetyltransferase-like isoleucine patch superfamily enzyme
MLRNFSFQRLVRYFFLILASLPMFAHHRPFFLKRAGIKIKGRCHIYSGVRFDTVHPEYITIGKNVRITAGTVILTHYLEPNYERVHFRYGKVVIEDDVFIGVNSVICNSVTIGKGAIIGAGSIVTKDIPPYQVWAGNPARFVKDRQH